MRQKSVPVNEPATQVLKNVRRATRRHFSAEDKIRIVLEGLRGEDSIAELCRREGIVQNLGGILTDNAIAATLSFAATSDAPLSGAAASENTLAQWLRSSSRPTTLVTVTTHPHQLTSNKI
jgi:transposase